MRWVGYKCQLTETCDSSCERPHLITNVETTVATTPDDNMVAVIHANLERRGLLPGEHLVDKGYTDSRVQAVADSFDVFKGEIDGRLRHMDRRIDRQGAMGAAMLNMATSAAGIRTQNRVGVGVGFQGGESALSVGYQRAINDRATVTFGGALSGDEKSVGVGAGFGW